jgi:hypothetical protein
MSAHHSRRDQQRESTRQKLWQNQNPKARWAHICLASALRRGLLHKQPCRDCGNPKVDGHHTDYDRPMVVVWLCRRHHIAEHCRLKEKANG